MNMDILILLMSCFINFSIGLVVFARNHTNTVNKIFGYLAISIIFWSVLNYFSENIAAHALLYNRLTFAAAIVMTFLLMLLANYFPSGKSVMTRKMLLVLGVVSLLFAGFCLTPLLIEQVEFLDPGVNIFVGILYIPYSIFAFYLLFLVAKSLITTYKISSAQEKSHIKLLAFGTAVSSLLTVLTNLILPILLDNSSVSRTTPLYSIIFMSFVAFAIIRHRLFDPRLVLVRLLAYVFSLIVFLSLVLAGFIVLAGSILGVELMISDFLLYGGIAIAAAAVYPYLVKFFNNLTTRIFYQDGYNKSEVHDQLSMLYNSSWDVADLSISSNQMVSEALGVKHSHVVINDSPKKPFISNEGRDFRDKDFPKTLLGKEVDEIVTDDMPDSEFKKSLVAEDISVVLPVLDDGEITGYWLFGPKSSGTIYYSEDISFLKVITSNFGLAISNAKKFEQLQDFNKRLRKEVRSATSDLRDANKKLRELDIAKDDFMSMTSHQLKPQLTATQGFVAMLEEGIEGKLNEKQQELVNLSKKGVERMTNIVTGLLDLPRSSSGDIKITKTKTDMNKLIKEEALRLQARADKRWILITARIPKNTIHVKVDRLKIAEAVSNLLRNAIDYSPDSSEIVVTLTKDTKNVSIEVLDEGIGVPNKERNKLFTKFYRGNNAKKARPAGTGVGLFFAKNIVDAHKGEMVYKPNKPKGSVFGFRLPLT